MTRDPLLWWLLVIAGVNLAVVLVPALLVALDLALDDHDADERGW